MGTRAGKVYDLFTISQMVLEGLGGEGGATVAHELDGYNTIVQAASLKLLHSIQGLMGIQMALEFHSDVATCIVNQNASTSVSGSVGIQGSPFNRKSLCGTDKVIN